MIFPDVEDVVSPARMLDTAGHTIPSPAPAMIIMAMEEAMDSDSLSVTSATASRRNPITMIVKGLSLWTNLRYIRLKQAFVTPWTPRNSPVTDVETASSVCRYVGILVGRRKAIVIAMKMVR